MTTRRYSRTRYRRRGVLLVLTVVLMGAVGGLVSILALNSAHRYRDRESERARRVATALVDSGVVYARSRLPEWKAHPPAEPIQLDAEPLPDARMTGHLLLKFPIVDGGRVCRISAEVRRGPYVSTDSVEIDLGVPSTPTPASTQPASASVSAN